MTCVGRRGAAYSRFSRLAWWAHHLLPRKISIRASRRQNCLPRVARPATAVRAASPRAASASRSICSCKSTMRATRPRPGRSRPIWNPWTAPSAVRSARLRMRRSRRQRGRHGHRCARRCRCRGVRARFPRAVLAPRHVFLTPPLRNLLGPVIFSTPAGVPSEVVRVAGSMSHGS